jgi:hypothetical protein
MKRILLPFMLLLLVLLSVTINTFAQQTFDIISFKTPDSWEQTTSDAGIRFMKEDAATGGYCFITLYKSVPATADAKENFKLVWTSLVKDIVHVDDVPEMSPSKTDDGFDVMTGHANFERDSVKGVAILINSTGFGKMVNILILTNTDIYEKQITAFLESVTIKKQEETPSKLKKELIKLSGEDQAASSKPVTADGYTFNTSNFDDGWTSTVHEDWVQVIKGTTRVLIHYSSKETGYNADAMQGLKNAWNVLVAPKYSGMSNVDYKSIRGYEPMEMAEADATDISTGQQVHIVLFKKNYSGGSGKYLECITPDRNLFVEEFGEYDPNASNWEKLERLANYNKFAVAASDLMGKWTSNFSGSLQYVNANTGLYAGMNTHASNEKFHFSPGNKYTWSLGVASGMVGNIKFQNAKAAGKFAMVGNWQINLSDIEGKPKTYDVSFVCMKGLRVLWMNGTAYVREE